MKNLINKSNNKNYKSQNQNTMKTTENLTQENVNNSVMKQVDYLKIKLEDVVEINHQYLIDHPTIKNRYKIKVPENNYRGKALYGKNIDIYHNNDILYLSTSFPYLRHEHNYINFSKQDVLATIQDLSDILDVDLSRGVIIDFEIGKIFHPETSFKYISKYLRNLFESKLLKNSKNFISYGDNRFQLKVYEIIPNLKRKLSKKVFADIKFEKANPIKVEIKVTNSNIWTVEDFFEYFHTLLECYLDLLLEKINMPAAGFDYCGENFDDILYRALIKSNDFNMTHVNKLVSDEINDLNISYAKKSARRKSLINKQKRVTIYKSNSFLNLLLNRNGEPPLFDVEKAEKVFKELSMKVGYLISDLNKGIF